MTLSRDRSWMGSLVALTGVLTLVQLFLFVLFTLQASGNLLATGNTIRLEVQRTAPADGVQEFLVAARDLESVERVEYVTREQAYERERLREPDLVSFLEEFNIQNPFPDTVAVTLASLDGYDEFAAFARKPEWSRIVDAASLSAIGSQEREVEEMRSLMGSLQTLSLVLSLILFFVCVALLVEFVRRRALSRHDEIAVERVSGAPPFSLLLPFATESSVLLLVGSILSVVLLWIVIAILPALVPSLGFGGSLAALRNETGRILLLASIPVALAELVAIPLVSLFGAWLGIRKEASSMR
jgi:cell division protein FtsX